MIQYPFNWLDFVYYILFADNTHFNDTEIQHNLYTAR